MPEIFFISDTHFSHNNILKYSEATRPFKDIGEHDNALISAWNSVVGKRDTVWHLGDITFCRRRLHEIMPQLNGYKKLVLGNHDNFRTEEYLKYFSKIHSGVFFKGQYILTHIPVHPCQFYRAKVNIHGHLHQDTLEDRRYCNVCVDVIGLAPKPFDTIREELQCCDLL